MGAAFLAWLGAFLTPFAPSLAAWVTPKAPIPPPPDPSKPAVDAGDKEARDAAKKRADGAAPP